MNKAHNKKIAPKVGKPRMQKFDIIQSILEANFDGLKNALVEDSDSINAIHKSSGMNVAMLCAYGNLPRFLEESLHYGENLNFEHRNKNGENLLYFGFSSLDGKVHQLILEAYKKHAPHLVNNPPAPLPEP